MSIVFLKNIPAPYSSLYFANLLRSFFYICANVCLKVVDNAHNGIIECIN